MNATPSRGADAPRVEAAEIEVLSTGRYGVIAIRLTSNHGASKRWGSTFNNDPDGHRMAEDWCKRLVGRSWGSAPHT